MLDELDITSMLIERGLAAPIYHWRDRRSGEILAFDMTELADVTRYPFRIQCEQYHLSRALSDRLLELPSARMLFDHKLVSVTQDERGVVALVESAGETREIRCDYLIGADGASSRVRKSLAMEFEGFTYDEKFLTLSTPEPLELALPGLAAVNYVSDPDEWLVLLRIPTLWRVLVPTHDRADDYLVSDAAKTDIFTRLIGHGADVQTIHRTIYRIHQRVAKQFQVGRIFLVGDAAHLNNPLGGFGMNSGIHDAFNLTKKMIEVIYERESAETLARYDRQRRKVTTDFTQRQTMENMELMRAGQGEAHARQRQRMREVTNDPDRRRAYLLRQSMLESLADAEAIQ